MDQDRVKGLNSPMGRLSLANKSKKVLTVDDPTEAEPTESEDEIIQRLEQARLAKKQAKEVASPNAIHRLEILAGIGRLTRDVVVDKVTFTMRSLKGREMRAVMVATSQAATAVEQAFELRAQTVARALTDINGQMFELVLGTTSLDDKIEFVQEFDENLLVRLHETYTAMVLESKQKAKDDLGKDAEEVIDNIKKS